MKFFYKLLAAAFIFLLSGCSQFLIDDENDKQLTGKIKDQNGNLLSDVKVYVIYNFEHYWIGKDINFNGLAGSTLLDTLSHTPVSEASVLHNYPNPFTSTTNFTFSLEEISYVKFDVLNFNGSSVKPSFYTDTLPPGTYRLLPDFSETLPCNGYKMKLTIEPETDSIVTFEWSFIRSYRTFDSTLLSTIPNALSVNGRFEIKYNELPLQMKYIETDESDPQPHGFCQVKNTITLVLHKPGYKLLTQDFYIWNDRHTNKDFIMEKE